MADHTYKKNWIFKSLRWMYHRMWYAINFFQIRLMPFHIASIDETLDTLLESGRSIARFGDGEYKWVCNIPNPSFQRYSDALAQRLRQVVASNDPRVMIGLCDCFGDLKKYCPAARDFWELFIAKNRRGFYSLLNPDTAYYAMMTRFYIDYADKSKAGERFKKLMQLWAGRDVLIVEGEKTRFGVNNDFLAAAASVRRILAPATNAFERYDDIFVAVQRHIKQNQLILMALGPTATILAYDVAVKLGEQAIDIGHADIEYEWYLAGATEKIPVANKYTNECGYTGGEDQLLENAEYQSQIVERII